MEQPPQSGPLERQPAVVVRLRDLDAGALSVAGGKAANLGELLGAGFPVPDGFCVTTSAYGEVAATSGLDDVLGRLRDLTEADSAEVVELAGRARECILRTGMPDGVADGITAAYRELGEPAVAVRSSATAEDLPFASFAGQQDTYLNVVGADAVLDAVHRCWASLWTDRAVLYRVRNGVEHAGARLAVVVQRLVDAAAAGVLFTANPVTGRRGEAVIDASPGLGEAVVSGAVNPDHLVVDAATEVVRERRVGDKRLLVRPRDGGGTESVEQAPSDTGCLADEHVRALVRLGVRLEEHFGRPQDAEWALDRDGVLWLTQARPITTLFPVPDGRPAGPGLRVYFCMSLAQGLTRPMTPMGLAAFRVLGSSAAQLYGHPPDDPVAGPPVVHDAAGRLFFDVTTIVRSTPGRALFPRVLDVMEARSAAVLRGLFDDPRLALVHRSWRPFARRVAVVAARYRVPLVVAQALVSPAAAHRRLDRIVAGLRPAGTGPPATAAQRFDRVVENLGSLAPRVVPRVAPPVATGFAMLYLAGRLLGADARPGDLATVLRGLPHNVTTEMDLQLWGLATAVRADPDAAATVQGATAAELADRYRAGTLPPVLRDGLREVLERSGHRAVAEIDVGLPRWAEDPTHLLGVLANYLRLEDPDGYPDAVFARAVAQAEAKVSELTGRAAARSRVRGRAVGFALDRARRLAGLRELPKYCLVLAFADVRAQLLAIGADLAAAGLLDRADDVFFLDLREVSAALGESAAPGARDLRAVVAERRDDHGRELRRRHVPRVLLSDGTEPEAAMAAPAAADGALAGTAASAGTVTGPARVVLEPTGAHLLPGDILVAPSTDPGWTPLFLTAGGLVMEMGGANSHGAVVAREYGIPAVVGVADATSRIAPGQRVTVDGTHGLVTPAATG
ncbi:PEP-utilizing enzyme [Geodermatophilus sp. YIM 151500]|uniref:PEP/pyruvate-binding domain-containing protein n=1 Tax=Geodermatophilus sp. YIM 151500 TaxID=2984531 RepID=UPI0021E4617B|nr:PEP/pyruvate-binding domain-containing protein [Geodermatophilus sp. YIM 151500]MCV2488559.1 PEP-utilizing enzyme [Geodermatophilus sp. YIM 151500]